MVGAAREPHGKRAVSGWPDHWMGHVFEEAAELQLCQLGLPVWLDDLADWDTGIPQALDDVVGLIRAAPLSQVLVDPVVLPRPSGRGRECGVRRPLRLTEGTAE